MWKVQILQKKKKDFLLIEIGKILLHRFESLNTACTSDGHKRSVVVVGVVGVGGRAGGATGCSTTIKERRKSWHATAPKNENYL